MRDFFIDGHFVDIPNKEIFPARVQIKDRRIESIQKLISAPEQYLLPGFIDAHVHIESSMLVPSEFARLAVVHGTVATVSDPHEIANVCGIKGVEYMIDNGNQVNFHFYFGAPSCVPATTFETSGAKISALEMDGLLSRKEVPYMAEMMNWPGTVNRDPEVMKKIEIARKHGKPIDGHAPGLKGEMAEKYVSAGITTDHECYSYEEAAGKLLLGMKILIREGSAAKNFDELIDLIDRNEDKIMFCSDDKHPDSLEAGHINQLVARAVAKGKDIFKVLKAACINPAEHYQLDVGRLRIGDNADFILVNDLVSFEVQKNYINGILVAEKSKSLIPSIPNKVINNFKINRVGASDFRIKGSGTKIRVIAAMDGQLITPEESGEIVLKDGFAQINLPADILKIAVINRYEKTSPAVAFIRNFGLREGALASSVAHDSHNIIAVGVDDASISKAVNFLMDVRGGLTAVSERADMVIPLPVGGLMSPQDGYMVANAYTEIDKMAKEMGSGLQSPFMTLSFMALLVIPELKLSDKGLFNGKNFEFVELFIPT